MRKAKEIFLQNTQFAALLLFAFICDLHTSTTQMIKKEFFKIVHWLYTVKVLRYFSHFNYIVTSINLTLQMRKRFLLKCLTVDSKFIGGKKKNRGHSLLWNEINYGNHGLAHTVLFLPYFSCFVDVVSVSTSKKKSGIRGWPTSEEKCNNKHK